jgi:regulatory protein
MDNKAYFFAVRFLQYRPRSIKEIKDYLKKKNINETEIEKAIEELLEQKFLNDEEFAKMWVRTRVALKPLSQRVLRLELLQKGIDKEIIDTVLAETAETSGNDLEMARLLAQKKKEKYKNLSRDEVYKKLGGFLMRRGFTYDIAKRSIDEVFGT